MYNARVERAIPFAGQMCNSRPLNPPVTSYPAAFAYITRVRVTCTLNVKSCKARGSINFLACTVHLAAVAVVAGAVAPAAAAAISIAASTLQTNRRTNKRTNPGASCKLQRYIFLSL